MKISHTHTHCSLCRHVVLKYGKPNVPTAKQRTLLSEESRRKRVAELSKMYRLGKARGGIIIITA